MENIRMPTRVRFLDRHQNGRYYVRTFASGKEKWTSVNTLNLPIARNRTGAHLDAAGRQRPWLVEAHCQAAKKE
jgi:hypothetical protein